LLLLLLLLLLACYHICCQQPHSNTTPETAVGRSELRRDGTRYVWRMSVTVRRLVVQTACSSSGEPNSFTLSTAAPLAGWPEEHAEVETQEP
jgi:hypothetical protein